MVTLFKFLNIVAGGLFFRVPTHVAVKEDVKAFGADGLTCVGATL